jgi:glycosyltransferase involved in cell wall biosynthesis
MVVQPLVSVIVPNYNHEKYLEQRLESIFNQTYSNYEVILMDDCSTDNSLSILHKYEGHEKVVKSVFNKTNTGNTFKQWAKGIQMAKGELVWIAETDDYCDKQFLERLVQSFNADSEVVLAFCQSNRVNEKGEITGNWITYTDDLDARLFQNDFVMDGNLFVEKFLINRNVIPNASAVVFRKEAVDIHQHLDIAPEFRYCGDWMFYFKFILNKKIFFLSDSLNYFRYHSTSVIAKAIQSEKRLTFMDIEYKLRFVLMEYLNEMKISNYDKIKANNNFIKRNFITYEKALLFIQTGKKVKGYLMMLTVFDVYLKRNNIKKRMHKKIKKIFSYIKQ